MTGGPGADDAGGAGRDLPATGLLFDVGLMLVFAGLGAVLLTVMAQHERPEDYVFVVAQTLPLALRRRFPRASLAAVYAVAVIQGAVGVLIGMYNAAVPFALYTTVGYTDRRTGRLALAGGLLTVLIGAFTGWWRWVDLQMGSAGLGLRPWTTVGALSIMVAAWALGDRLRVARLGRLALAQQAEQLLREREQQAQLAAAAERARIAREMHDVIAHGLSVMIAQADGAAYVVEQSPATAKQALAQIGSTGRAALNQMRDLLGLLRSDGEAAADGAVAGPVGHHPQPDLDDLDELVAQARDGGASVAVQRVGETATLSPLVSLTAYRIVQEGLTNARKYGGAAVEVRLTRERGGLRVEVRDDGRGDAPPMSNGAPGHGLIGMRERVAAVNGTLRVGPRPAGGYEVAAWLPDAEGHRG